MLRARPPGPVTSAIAPAPASSAGKRLAANPFIGAIDDVAFYNKALTPDQIQTHYLDGVRLDHHQAGEYKIVLSWPMGTLQQAGTANGSYTDLTGGPLPTRTRLRGPELLRVKLLLLSRQLQEHSMCHWPGLSGPAFFPGKPRQIRMGYFRIERNGARLTDRSGGTFLTHGHILISLLRSQNLALRDLLAPFVQSSRFPKLLTQRKVVQDTLLLSFSRRSFAKLMLGP